MLFEELDDHRRRLFGKRMVAGMNEVTTGVPVLEGYKVHHFSHCEPVSSQPLSLRRASIVAFCHSNLTSGSFSPATCRTGLGFNSPIERTAADDGAMAANTSPRAAQSKYV